jgi:ElaB/YqjD/DUF883 family membrane-anchored ribosome-binding protein
MTMDIDDDRMSAREYAREATRIRTRLASELDQLHGRLSFGQIFDEVLGYTKSGGSTFFGAFSNATRENPIPSLLIASGCMMLLSEKMGLNRYLGADSEAPRQTMRAPAQPSPAATSGLAAKGAEMADGVRRTWHDTTESVSSAAANARGNIAGAAEQTRQTVGETVDRARETARGALDQAQETARAAGDAVRGYSAAVGDQLTDTAARARDQTVAAAQQVKAQAKAVIEEQPLVVAAAGLALGALFAALLPPTDTEDQLMGETSDAVKQTVTETAGQVVEQAKAVAEREGLTPDAAVEAAKGITGKVRTVVKEAAEATAGNTPA